MLILGGAWLFLNSDHLRHAGVSDYSSFKFQVCLFHNIATIFPDLFLLFEEAPTVGNKLRVHPMFHLLKQATFRREKGKTNNHHHQKIPNLVRIDNLVQVRVQHSLVGRVESITNLAQQTLEHRKFLGTQQICQCHFYSDLN